MNTNKHKTAQPVKDLRDKFKEWKEILLGKDRHSIRNQILEMIWDSAVFQCINESRKYAAKDNKGNIKQNVMIHHFINQSFFKTQLLSIRKLIDKDFNRVQQNKPYTVYSLYNLIEDMKKNNALLTRKNILAAHNLPYDYKKAEARLWRKVGNTHRVVFGDPKISFSQNIHKQIDSMVGTTANKRSPADLIPDTIFRQFEDKLTSIEALCKYVDKFVAHSATPDSRKKIQAGKIKITLSKIFNAHEIICKTADSIGSKLLFYSCGNFLTTPQFDQFEYLDEPIASKETVEKLREFWEEYRKETEQWYK